MKVKAKEKYKIKPKRFMKIYCIPIFFSIGIFSFYIYNQMVGNVFGNCEKTYEHKPNSIGVYRSNRIYHK